MSNQELRKHIYANRISKKLMSYLISGRQTTVMNGPMKDLKLLSLY
jgi:hypothetical protein